MKTKKTISFITIGLSAIFLFNPNINIIDFLPDFIGYILLCLALTPLADMNDTLTDALAGFKKMILIDAAKIVALLWVFGISVVSERNSSLMLWAFTFGVLEVIFVIPSFIKLFKGLSELGYLYDNTSVVSCKKSDSKKNYTDRIRVLTVAFVSLKAIMSFLPELADLTSSQYSENAGFINMYRYIGIMRTLAFIPVLIVGIFWIIKFIAYFKRISNDVSFAAALENLYNERVASKKGIFVKRNINISFVVLLTALFFSFDFRLENVNMLPDFACAALLFAFFISIAKKTNISLKLPLFMCSLYFAASTWTYVSEFMFFKNFSFSAVDRDMEARISFVNLCVSTCTSSVLFAACILLVLLAIKKVINEHTGAISVSGTSNQSQQKMTDAIRAELGKYIIICIVLTVVYIATDICYILLAKDYSFMFLINVIGTICCIAAFAKLYFEVAEAVNSRYILE